MTVEDTPTVPRDDFLAAFEATDPPTMLRALLEDVQPEELVAYVPDLDREQRLMLLEVLGPEKASTLFDDLDDDTARSIAKSLSPSELSRILAHIAPDEGADLMSLLPDSGIAEQALQSVEPEKREEIEELVSYDPETAAGIMTTEFAALPLGLTVAEAMVRLRTLEAEYLSVIYITDDAGHLKGTIELEALVKADPRGSLDALTEGEHLIKVRLNDDQEEVANRLNLYDLISIPVVDDEDVLRGVVTFDDVLDVRDEEAAEDLYMIAGQGELTINSPVSRRVKSRLPWLFIPLLSGLVASVILTMFQATLDQVAALTAFIPIIAGMAGNVGIQSSTLVVRALAVGHVEKGRGLKMVITEVTAGMVLGLACGILTGIAAHWMKGVPQLWLVVSSAMIVSMSAAAVVGTAAPLICDQFGIDPAVAAGPFVTMLNDVLALLVYLGVATLLL